MLEKTNIIKNKNNKLLMFQANDQMIELNLSNNQFENGCKALANPLSKYVLIQIYVSIYTLGY